LVDCLRGTQNLKSIYCIASSLRGQTARINVADALGRQVYHAAGLGTDFELTISVVRCCLKIRNQFSHCNWYNDRTGRLAFVNVEAHSNQLINDFESLTRYYIDVLTLDAQERYFSYANALLTYANYEGRLRAGKLKSNVFERPAQMTQPPLHAP
jgi:hypothetical protein